MHTLCVTSCPAIRVIERGGFHKFNGHTAQVMFNDNGACYVACSDDECQTLAGKIGQRLFNFNDDIVKTGLGVFNRLE